MDRARRPDTTCIQVAASLFDQRLSRGGFFAECRRRERLVFVRSVFLQGVAHLGPDAVPAYLTDLRRPLTAAREWADSRHAAPALAFLAFAAGLDGARILLGCETVVQLQENLTAWEAAQDAVADVEAWPTQCPILTPKW